MLFAEMCKSCKRRKRTTKPHAVAHGRGTLDWEIVLAYAVLAQVVLASAVLAIEPRIAAGVGKSVDLHSVGLSSVGHRSPHSSAGLRNSAGLGSVGPSSVGLSRVATAHGRGTQPLKTATGIPGESFNPGIPPATNPGPPIPRQKS